MDEPGSHHTERSSTQKITYDMTVFIQNVQKRKQISGYLWLKGEDNYKKCMEASWGGSRGEDGTLLYLHGGGSCMTVYLQTFTLMRMSFTHLCLVFFNNRILKE